MSQIESPQDRKPEALSNRLARQPQEDARMSQTRKASGGLLR